MNSYESNARSDYSGHSTLRSLSTRCGRRPVKSQDTGIETVKLNRCRFADKVDQ
jgi:hypothetical protein